MSNKIYGQYVTTTAMVEKAKKIFAENLETFEVLEEHESTFEDVLDAMKMNSLARYLASHGLCTTVVYAYVVDDKDFEDKVCSLFW